MSARVHGSCYGYGSLLKTEHKASTPHSRHSEDTHVRSITTEHVTRITNKKSGTEKESLIHSGSRTCVAEPVCLQVSLMFLQVARAASTLHKGAAELCISVHPKDAYIYIHRWKCKHTHTHTHRVGGIPKHSKIGPDMLFILRKEEQHMRKLAGKALALNTTP